MKVGIICFWDRYATPYLSKYEQLFDEKHVDYDVILWDRGSTSSEQFKSTDIVIKIPVLGKKHEKLRAMLLWRKRILDILRRKKYTKLVILSTSPGILLFRYLEKYYKRNYIFDIRDYTYELFNLYFSIEKKVINNSWFTTISSKGFESWLPKHDYVLNHNITHCVESSYRAKDLRSIRPLNFSFIGNLRVYDATYNMILALKDVDWIQQSFVGREIGGKHLEKIKDENQISNMKIEGAFLPEEKPSVYKNVHFINSAYGSKDRIVKVVVDTAISNKLYDAATFRCPIVASKGTFLAEQVCKYGLGFAVDYDAHDAETAFLEYLAHYDADTFEKNCNEFLRCVRQDEEVFKEKVMDFVLHG